MKKRIFKILALALGIATVAFADELDMLIYKQRGITPPKEAPAPAPVVTKDQMAVPEKKLTVPKSESIFPVGSQSSRSANNLLQIVVPEGGTNTFPAGSRAFHLQDGTLKVVVPETQEPTSAVVPEDLKPAPVTASPLPVAVSPNSD